LAAYTTPPQPIAIAQTATTSLRKLRAVADLGLWESVISMAIGNALSLAFFGLSMI
jgi:hypothetical protein